MKIYDVAIQLAFEGLEIAENNTHYKYIFDFWTLLGAIYTATSSLEEAEDCFDTALSMKHKLESEKTATTTG
ncbi:hypothetical protein [Paludifilum halophilum]|uniref:Tetratricopeptide repeat protein n=1 Tax=Paludifilum halophilum TaxID=1642702 RepID=A0A235B709_9BACL|nr:hypothetical protein [Paludifilum halophilum]OYD08084.1 hypothetical protein CHM34_08200 [Paludifilum halophilum]